MIYDWYFIFNKTEFDALNVFSKTYTLIFQDLGEFNILVTKGNLYSVLFEGIYLSSDLNMKNPFEFEGHAIFVDEANDIYIGLPVDES